jgi:prophage tail gpP-like protein
LDDFVNPFGQITDGLFPLLGRFRPHLIFNETNTTNAIAEARARWEARVRAGKSRKIIYTVKDWTQSNGEIWDLNSLVQVEDNFFDIQETLLISQLVFSLDQDGTETQITVVHPDTYELFTAPVEKPKTKLDPLPKQPAVTDWAANIVLVE